VRRAAHLRRVIFERDQQQSGPWLQQRQHLPGVGAAHRRRQCDQRGAVEHGVDRAELACVECKEIATAQIDSLLPGLRRGGELRIELLHGKLRQFDADDLMTALREPQQVVALAGQRHEHAAACGQCECGPVAIQRRVRCVLVEADLVALPALVPELRFHC